MVYVKIFIYVTLQFPISNKNFSGGGGYKGYNLTFVYYLSGYNLTYKKKFLRNVIN